MNTTNFKQLVSPGWLFLLTIVFIGTPLNADPVTIQPPPEPKSKRVPKIQKRIYRVLEKQCAFLLKDLHTWDEKKSPPMKLITKSKHGEHWIRPNTSALLSLSFLWRFGPYHRKHLGRTKQQLLNDVIIPMIRYLVSTHVTGDLKTGDGKSWGDQWQSAHWSSALAHAGWWTWDQLPEDLQSGIKTVVRHEAQRFVNRTPPSQVRGDTKAEENAWNSQILLMASILMPDDKQATPWRTSFRRWALSSFLRKADQKKNTVIDGQPLAQQYTGANIHNDFTLENHGIVHPDYMTTWNLTFGRIIDYRMIGQDEPDALYHNVEEIYQNNVWFTLPDGGFLYPSGQDWRLFRNPDWILIHMLMATIGGKKKAAWLAGNTLKVIEKMQNRSDRGSIYLPGEYFFASTQQMIGRMLVYSWLALEYSGRFEMPEQMNWPTGIRHFHTGNIILHRTNNSIHSLNWNKHINWQYYPMTRDRLTSPIHRSGVGIVKTKGEKKTLPVKLKQIDIQKSNASFTARMLLHHGNAVESRILLNSKPNGQLLVQERWTARKNTTLGTIGSGLIGILNNKKWIYEDGMRTLTAGKKKFTFPSGAGKTVKRKGVKQINIDDQINVKCTPECNLFYKGANGPERGRTTDRLFLNYRTGPIELDEGDVIFKNQYLLTPDE